MDSDTQATAPAQPKTKQEALECCLDQHVALVTCFKTCSLWSSFTGCCVEEHRRFWECYTHERGTNATKVTAWFGDKFGATDPPAKTPPSKSNTSAAGQQQQEQ